MLLKFIGTSSQVDVETGYGERTVNPGDYIYATEEAGLHERYQDLFEVVEVGGEIKQKKTTITSAQVLALNTTPIAIVPAP